MKLMHNFDESIDVSVIVSGKLRRYHHLSLVQHLMIPSVVFPNILDGFKVIFGTIQSFFKLLFNRPDVIFLKGGYVCLPVGWAAKILRIPYVIHDSDAHPGLTNRLLSKSAKKIATGAPLKYYKYPKSKSKYVGIPVSNQFKKIDKKQAQEIKQKLGFKKDRKLVVVTGGGLGAKRINDSIIRSVDDITNKYSLMLISGAKQYEELKKKYTKENDNFKLVDFVSEGMSDIINAADLAVARAGATSIMELAAAEKPTILVPNARLTGGHQTKNAKVYADADAVELADEDKFEKNKTILINQIEKIISNEKRLKELQDNISEFAKPNAAKEVAELILLASK